MGNRNLTVPLVGVLTFGALLSASKPRAGAPTSGDAKLPSDLGGKMPPSFDQDVARVVDDIDRIEADTLSQMEHTANRLHPVQKMWIQHNVPQCGYCQSGQIMQPAALWRSKPKPSDKEIEEAMEGNICRCGTYERICSAIKAAAEEGA
ncbi:MAG TPA: 2Fe-2S iron-sulfur cluster-binding protein [Candidatus Acidoferrum sp.]